MARHSIATLSFEDLAVNDEWESPRRTVTEADVVAFAGLSGDFNPIHVDHLEASKSPFRKPMAHGLLGLAIASGLASNAPRVDTMAFLTIVDWKFLKPLFFGDTVGVVSRVAALDPKARGRRGIVTWHRRLVNQDGEVVQEGTIQTLVRARAKPNDSAAPSPE